MASVDLVKVSIPVWDSDKDEHGYRKWSKCVSGMVRSRKGGEELERFKAEKLGVSERKVLIPSFLANDPDFDDEYDNGLGIQPVPKPAFTPNSPADLDKLRATDKSKSDEDGKSIPRTATPKRIGEVREEQFFQASKPYSQLSEEAQALDKHMYSSIP